MRIVSPAQAGVQTDQAFTGSRPSPGWRSSAISWAKVMS